jgi:hypothetical protein
MRPIFRTLLLGAPVLLLCAMAIWLLLEPAVRSAAPDEASWAEAADYVKERFQPGDFIRIEPFWMTSGRAHFVALDGGPSEPFRILDYHRVPDHSYLSRFTRLWLVAAAGEGNGPDMVSPPGSTLLDERSFDRISVFLFEIPSGVLVWQMLENLPLPKVKRELRQVAGGARECALVRPGKEPVSVSFQVPSPGVLLIRVGNTVEAARRKEGGDVAVTLLVNGEKAAGTLLERRAYRLDEMRVPLDGPGPHEVTVRFETDDARRREVCMDGYVVLQQLLE